jgi:hypothetical protein
MPQRLAGLDHSDPRLIGDIPVGLPLSPILDCGLTVFEINGQAMVVELPFVPLFNERLSASAGICFAIGSI